MTKSGKLKSYNSLIRNLKEKLNEESTERGKKLRGFYRFLADSEEIKQLHLTKAQKELLKRTQEKTFSRNADKGKVFSKSEVRSLWKIKRQVEKKMSANLLEDKLKLYRADRDKEIKHIVKLHKLRVKDINKKIAKSKSKAEKKQLRHKIKMLAKGKQRQITAERKKKKSNKIISDLRKTAIEETYHRFDTEEGIEIPTGDSP